MKPRGCVAAVAAVWLGFVGIASAQATVAPDSTVLKQLQLQVEIAKQQQALLDAQKGLASDLIPSSYFSAAEAKLATGDSLFIEGRIELDALLDTVAQTIASGATSSGRRSRAVVFNVTTFNR